MLRRLTTRARSATIAARVASAEPALARLQIAWLTVHAGKTCLLVTNLVIAYAAGGVAALGFFGAARFLVPTIAVAVRRSADHALARHSGPDGGNARSGCSPSCSSWPASSAAAGPDLLPRRSRSKPAPAPCHVRCTWHCCHSWRGPRPGWSPPTSRPAPWRAPGRSSARRSPACSWRRAGPAGEPRGGRDHLCGRRGLDDGCTGSRPDRARSGGLAAIRDQSLAGLRTVTRIRGDLA